MFVVAGASGRTGTVVAETLLAQGRKVRVVLRDPGKAARWRGRAEVAIAALEDAAALGKALDGARGFYVLLPEDPLAADFDGPRRRMVEAIPRAVSASRVPQVVLLSGMPAALPDGNGPGRDLHALEHALRATGAVVTVLRASAFQENVLEALEPARREAVYPCFLPSAEIAFPTAATRDLGRLAAHCLAEPPPRSEIVDVVGPTYSTRQLAGVLGAALGKTLRVIEIPAAAQAQVLRQAGLSAAYAESLAEMFACLASGRVQPRGDRMVPVTTTLEEILPGLLAGR